MSFVIRVITWLDTRGSTMLERNMLGVRGAVALVGAGVGGAGLLVHVGFRCRLELEVAVRVDPADEHRRSLVLHAQMPDRGRDVADRQTDAAAVRAIGL